MKVASACEVWEPLHEEVDRLAVEGADKESDDEDILYLGGRGQEMGFNCVDDADKSKNTHLVPNSEETHQGARREDVVAN